MRRYSFDLKSAELTPETLAGHDLVLLATDHDRFDYDMIERHAKLIVDTRGRYLGARKNVVKA
jgi:UDP-N-acetyl-D-glucosamine dehydrogenase